MKMARKLQEIIDHAEELASRFASEDFGAGEEPVDAATLRELSRAVRDRADAEVRLAEAVGVARAYGHSWSTIGGVLGTSGEAARQRYGASTTGSGAPVDLMAALERSVREAKAARKASSEPLTSTAGSGAVLDRLEELERLVREARVAGEAGSEPRADKAAARATRVPRPNKPSRPSARRRPA
jgi:hypothetical protein